MIVHYDGSVLSSDANVICQQVNCKGVMGSGLAKEIRTNFPPVYDEYHKKCLRCYGDDLLGLVQYVTVNGITFANCFGQVEYGRDGKKYTEDDALRSCFKDIASTFHSGETIAIPYKIGCELGGGDWDAIYKIIEEEFKDYDGVVEIWKYR